MGHPDIRNDTPFAFQPVFIADEDMRPVVVTVVKATFSVDAEGLVQVAGEQVPVNLSGEPWSEAPVSSYRYEPETALHKPATDVVLVGHVLPPGNGAAQVDAGIKVGPVSKLARVFADRYWVRRTAGIGLWRAAKLEPVPLTWERAFGGRDAARSTPERPVFEPRNPVGTGFGTPLVNDGDHVRLPNIEDPNQVIQRYGDAVTPCGFGFTSPDWQPRAGFAGTYDDQWSRQRKPLLPVDFDRRFFNAAAPGLVAPGYLRGDEDVVVLNAGPVPRLAFRLPGVPPPRCRVAVRGRPDAELRPCLDTIIVNTDDMLLMLIWRAYALTAGGPHDVTAIQVAPGD